MRKVEKKSRHTVPRREDVLKFEFEFEAEVDGISWRLLRLPDRA